MNNEILLAARYNNVFSLIMIDIDFFKKVNDVFGHIVGDFVLKKLAEILLVHVKEQGLCARWGGEEFLVFIPYQTQEQIVQLVEKIRSEVENYVFQYQDKTIKITISCGISFYPQEGRDISTLINEADKKLYKAKQSGRNKVVVWNYIIYCVIIKIFVLLFFCGEVFVYTQISFLLPEGYRTSHKDLDITFIDVGQGDSIYL